MADAKVTIAEAARTLKVSEPQVESALSTVIGLTRIGKATRIAQADMDRLRVHFRSEAKKSDSKKNDATKTSSRRVGGTDVRERRGGRISMEALAAKSGVKIPTAPKKPKAEEQPAAKPVTKKAAEKIAAEAAAATGAKKPAKKKSAEKKPDAKPEKTAAKRGAKAATAADDEPHITDLQKQHQASKAAAAQEAQRKKEEKAAAKKSGAKAKDAKDAKPEAKTPTTKKPKPKGKGGKGVKAEADAGGEGAGTKKPPSKRRGKTIGLDKGAIARANERRRQQAKMKSAEAALHDNLHGFQKPVAPVVREIKLPKGITVSKLAMEMSLKSSEVISKLLEHGVEATINEVLDREVAWVIVEDLGHKPIEAPEDDLEQELIRLDFSDYEQHARAPVVTVMGHVDHGKTSLLDKIRETRVASGEAGGITQHMGAYRVESRIGAVTFLDTPGHALFTQMRARGAKVTDIVVLVVAADDGVQEQTVESINHAKAGDVPIIVAVNKIDKAEADVDRVKRELADHGVQPEEWGGDNLFVPISAATGEGIDNLLEALATQAEIMELKAAHAVPARGFVVETRIDKGRGVMATVIITQGVLQKGDIFVCGAESGRIRSMWGTGGVAMQKAEPSFCVEIQGLSGVPKAGVDVIVVDSEKKAREIVEVRRSQSIGKRRVLFNPISGGDSDAGASGTNGEGASAEILLEPEEFSDLNIVIKADVEGSREAMVHALSAISGKKAGVKVIHSGVGAVSESDVYLAQTGRGVVVAFNVRPNSKARGIAESRGVQIIYGNIVYDLVERVTQAVLNLLSPVVEETVIATAEVRDLFNVSKVGTVAGCLVKEGEVRANSYIRLIRDGKNVYDGRLSSLYHFKDPVQEVKSGLECGLSIARYNDIKTGDIIECIERVEIPPEM